MVKFIQQIKNPQIKVLEQFSSGHSRVQELDAVHSVTDRHLRHISYYSPLSLMRHLKTMKYDNVHLKLIQLQKKDFFNYSRATAGLLFIPYTTTKEIIYDNLTEIKYREDYGKETLIRSAPFLI